ncbi:NADH-quinone oxidoreductase subunit NuoE [Poriferisphaera sp. WC338]|uniref:NADH-quinone oxidoreductase subunit NuoE n=1 Tax=Poriferisphaera sp. WC338 TaxID=3425129 RepID=UPI003D8167DA
MAWITKNSAEMQIKRQDEPFMDDGMKSSLVEVLNRYPRKQAATLPVLHAVQEKVGWLPYQAIEEIADYLDIPASQVLDTASFYEEFWLKPRGKYVIWLCQSISCEVMGEPNLTTRIADHLGVKPGETTEDGKFTLMKVECLGYCGDAPCALVNEKVHGKLTTENFIEAIDALE